MHARTLLAAALAVLVILSSGGSVLAESPFEKMGEKRQAILRGMLKDESGSCSLAMYSFPESVDISKYCARNQPCEAACLVETVENPQAEGDEDDVLRQVRKIYSARPFPAETIRFTPSSFRTEDNLAFYVKGRDQTGGRTIELCIDYQLYDMCCDEDGRVRASSPLKPGKACSVTYVPTEIIDRKTGRKGFSFNELVTFGN